MSFPVPITSSLSVPTGFTSHTTDAANPDNTASPTHRRTPAKGGGWGSWWEAAEISGKEPGSRHSLQTEEEGLGDVTGKESRRTHPDKHAASGVGHCLFPQPSKALSQLAFPALQLLVTYTVLPHTSPTEKPQTCSFWDTLPNKITHSASITTSTENREDPLKKALGLSTQDQQFKPGFSNYSLCLTSPIYKRGINIHTVLRKSKWTHVRQAVSIVPGTE
jgi:hypothetical protein